MKLERQASYEMNLTGEGATGSAALAGLSFFLLVVYYFGFRNLSDFDGGALTLRLWLPLLLTAVYIVCLRGIRLDLPLLYGIFGAVWCLLVMILNFSCGSGFRILLSVIWYTVAGAALVLTVLGFIPTRLAVVGVFLVPLVYRLLVCELAQYLSLERWPEFLPEAAILSGLGAFACLGGALQKKDEI